MPGSFARVIRLGVGVVVGVVVGSVCAQAWGTIAGVVAGWAAGAALVAIWILLVIWQMDGAQTRAHATREDPGRTVARVIALGGSLASLAAVALVLVESRRTDQTAWVLAGLAVASVVVSWLLIQADYTLRLAREYYTDPVGGIDFNQDEDPQYTDFLYVSFGLGMTYQVADTNLRTNAMRRVVLAQTLLGYLFGAVILATVVNLVASLA